MFQTKLGTYIVDYQNQEEFHQLKTEIFTQHQYAVDLDLEQHPQPVIIDAGAHIGLATLYFKKLYPTARVIAIEPHPANFKLLEANVWQNNLTNIELHQIALAEHAGQLELHQDTEFDWFSSASIHRGAWNGEQQTQPITVPCQPLTDFLTQPIDLLKMDIEGSEQQVLLATGNQIELINHMMIEFHPTRDQNLPTLLDFLTKHHFQVQLWKKGKPIKLSQAHGLILIDAQPPHS